MKEEVKNSGIYWLGDIPMSWSIGRVKDFYTLQTGFTPDTKNDMYYDDVNGKLWVNISDLGNSYYINDTKKKISDYYIETHKPLIVPKGSLLYSFKLSVGTVAVAGCDLYTNEAIASFLNNDRVNLNYLYYSSQVCIIHNAIENIYGAKLLNQDLIKNAFIVFPPLLKQLKIADYLDKVCGEVDELVVLQEQMIEELKAYKQSIITEAVTKGLNPNVPMKNSGIDWIGFVPQDWRVARAKYFVTVNHGSDPHEEGDIPVYGSGASSFKTCGEYKEGAAVLVGRKGATLHIPHYIEGRYWNVDTAFDVKIRKEMILKYYYYLAICFDYKYYISQTTLPGMAQSSYYNMQIPIPSMNEQQQIASYLDTICTEIDSLIATKQQKIEELKEYKKSIIYEFVTGKKEVV